MNIGIVSAITDDSSKSIVDNYWGEVAYNLQLADGLTATLKLTYDYFERGPTMKIYPNGFAGLFSDGMIGKPLVKNRTMGGELRWIGDVFKGNHLIAGVSFEALEQYDVKQLANPLTGAPLGSIQEVANWNKDDHWDVGAHMGPNGNCRDRST